MEERVISLRKLCEALNTLAEAEVYIITLNGSEINVRKHRKEVVSSRDFPKKTMFFHGAKNYLLSELIGYMYFDQ